MHDILIYDVIGASMMDEGITPKFITEQLSEADGADVRVRINSPGGNVFDGIAILNILNGYEGKLTTQVDGLAASAASVIALAGSETVMADGAMMMIHEPWTVTVGNAEDHEDTINVLNKLGGTLAGLYAAKSGKDAGDIRQLMQSETWLSGDEAVEGGLASSVSEMSAMACKVSKEFGYKNQPLPPPLPTLAPIAKAAVAAALRNRKLDLTRLR